MIELLVSGATLGGGKETFHEPASEATGRIFHGTFRDVHAAGDALVGTNYHFNASGCGVSQ